VKIRLPFRRAVPPFSTIAEISINSRHGALIMTRESRMFAREFAARAITIA
jgi:hypothetical protein